MLKFSLVAFFCLFLIVPRSHATLAPLCGAQLQGGTNAEKLAFLEEVLATVSSDNMYSVNATNIEALTDLMQTWDINKGLSEPQIYEIVDAFHSSKELSPLWLSDWATLLTETQREKEALLRRRWQTELSSKGVFQTLTEMQLASPSPPASPFQKIKNLTQTVARAALMILPRFELTRSERIRKNIDVLAEEITELGPDSAYQRYAQKFDSLATAEIYLRFFRKVAQLTFVSVFVIVTTVEIDHRIYPIEGVWTSRKNEVQQMTVRAEAEYDRTYHVHMSRGLRAYLESQFSKESLRDLLYQERQQR